MKKTIFKLSSLLLIAVMIFVACNKDEATTTFNVRLTDAPADYDEVNIDVQSVLIHWATDADEDWMELENIEAGVYNLLEFSNGMDMLLASAELPEGQISQMRLILGDNNTIVVDGQTIDLTVPSSAESGLKFNIHVQLEAGVTYTMWIDFDAGRSIVSQGNGTYHLQPVLRTFTEATSGAIKGAVLPIEAKPHVMAIMGEDTLGTITDDEGNFMIGGVVEGVYKLVFTPVEGFDEKVIESVDVVNGEATDMGTVEISAVSN